MELEGCIAGRRKEGVPGVGDTVRTEQLEMVRSILTLQVAANGCARVRYDTSVFEFF
jgi:hypothetical protein